MFARVLIFVCLISISIFSMLIGETVEWRLVEIYAINWLWSAIIYRLIILSMIYLGLLSLFGYKSVFSKTLLVILALIIITDTILFYSSPNTSGALFIHPFYKNISLLALAILPVALSLFIFNNKNEIQLKKWLYVTLFLASIGISLIRIVYIEDWTNTSDNKNQISYPKALQVLNSQGINNSENSILMPFFSTSCPYCRIAAKKIAISAQQNKLPYTVIVFPGKKSDAELFMKENNLTNIPFISIDKNEFLALAGNRLPSVFYIEQKESTQWIGEHFNNIVLWKLSKSVN